ncbi:MAG: hypothetical protein GY711_14430 [bacterium]|nr:hypothetical protein [bacterium]
MNLTPILGPLLSLFVLSPAAPAQVWETCNLGDTFLGEAPGDQFGWVGLSAGDVDGDGVQDLIVGAPFNDGAGTNAGRAYVYAGVGGAALFTFDGASSFAQLGTDVAPAGDVDGDGFGDVIVGAPSNAGSPGVAYILLGPSGTLAHTLSAGITGDRFGASVSTALDVDGDGFDDVVVGAPADDTAGTNAGRLYVYSGNSGALIRTHEGLSTSDFLGASGLRPDGRARDDRDRGGVRADRGARAAPDLLRRKPPFGRTRRADRLRALAQPRSQHVRADRHRGGPGPDGDLRVRRRPFGPDSARRRRAVHLGRNVASARRHAARRERRRGVDGRLRPEFDHAELDVALPMLVPRPAGDGRRVQPVGRVARALLPLTDLPEVDRHGDRRVGRPPVAIPHLEPPPLPGKNDDPVR